MHKYLYTNVDTLLWIINPVSLFCIQNILQCISRLPFQFYFYPSAISCIQNELFSCILSCFMLVCVCLCLECPSHSTPSLYLKSFLSLKVLSSNKSSGVSFPTFTLAPHWALKVILCFQMLLYFVTSFSVPNTLYCEYNYMFSFVCPGLYWQFF